MQGKEAFAGSGLGLLVGMLLGLSSASVVGIVVTALTAGLAAFLGLVRTEGPDRALRIGFFGLACAIGVIGGLALRSGAWLAPNVQADVARWEDAGFPKEEARSLVAFQRLGVRPTARETGPAPTPIGALFSGHTGLCSRLERLPDPAMLEVLRVAEDQVGVAIAAATDAAAEPERAGVLHAGTHALCG